MTAKEAEELSKVNFYKIEEIKQAEIEKKRIQVEENLKTIYSIIKFNAEQGKVGCKIKKDVFTTETIKLLTENGFYVVAAKDFNLWGHTGEFVEILWGKAKENYINMIEHTKRMRKENELKRNERHI